LAAIGGGSGEYGAKGVHSAVEPLVGTPSTPSRNAGMVAGADAGLTAARTILDPMRPIVAIGTTVTTRGGRATQPGLLGWW